MIGFRRNRFRKIKRYRQIISTLFSYGFEDILIRLNLLSRRLLFKKLNPRRRRISRKPFEERVRLLLQDLGPTFVKLGQAMSLRGDILPDEITTELEKLQSSAEPFDFADVRMIVEEDLGKTIEELFTEFQEQPVAAASISQVHRAETAGGKSVAVKVQRPGIPQIIGADLAILKDLTQLAERGIPGIRNYRPTEFVDELNRTLKIELDFRQEGKSIDLFRKTFSDDESIQFPQVDWTRTSVRVLTMDYIDGVKISDIEALDAKGFDKHLIAERIASYVFRQVLTHGFFNADPHPGNFFVTGDSIVVPLDFGMIGYLDDEMRNALFTIVQAFSKKDVGKLVRAFQQIGVIDDDVDIPAVRRDLNGLLYFYYDMPLAQFNAERVFTDLATVLRRHRIAFPSELALTMKALLTVEGVAKGLDPEFNLTRVMQPFIRQYMTAKLDPKKNADIAVGFLEEVLQTAKDLPYDFGTLVKKAGTGGLSFKMEIKEFNRVIGELDKSFNRLAFSIVIAGMLVGSSLLTQSDSWPQLFGVPVVSLVGFVGAGFLGLWLVVGIIRSGRL